uniref:MAPK regulated corepressor interacting protein 2-like isoform X2 n=1 Tax=Pristiophorus japonicus TaxID=55135 RepID=UPI00398F4E03
MYTITRGPSRLATQRRTAWQQVEEELGASQEPENGRSTRRPVQYMEKTPNQNLKNFVPIDLEEWWAKQFLANIQNSS